VTQRKVNAKMGMGFDDDLFKEKLGRDPTDVECFDMGLSNSEHLRHWFSGGKIFIDGIEKPKTLFQLIKDTLQIGGPAYRIGIGGGAASLRVQSEGNIDLDFDAVQRGDTEIENRLNQLMRAYCDLGVRNPIVPSMIRVLVEMEMY